MTRTIPARVWQYRTRLSVLAATLLTAAAHAQSPQDLQVAFDANGLSSLRAGGAELLGPGPIGLQIDLRRGLGSPTSQPAETPAVAFDPVAHRLTQTYAWGTLVCDYRAAGDKLLLDLTVQNTGKTSVFGFTATPLHFKLPGAVTTKGWAHGWPTPSVLNDAPQVLTANWPGGSMAACNEQVDRPLWIGLNPAGEPGSYALVVRYEGPPRGQEISAGDSRQFSLSLRFGPAGMTGTQLAPDLYQRFAERYPSELNWDDRRPIGCCFLSSIESRSATNPTGWLHDASIDMTTDAGRADWKKRMLARFDKSVAVAKDMGLQGVIVWDIEGQRNPHAISYIGDPRLMPTLSPEMDPIADACFKKYTDAGLRCGVTLRPTHVVRTFGGKNAWEHVNVDDIVGELAGKLAYANKRWGCTLFYIDSTIRWDLSAEGEFSLHTLPAEIFQSLHRQFPDVLLIPEESTVRHHAYAAPYHEVMPPHNYTGTPAEVRACYPNAFSVIRVADLPVIEKNFDALVEAVRSGDILMCRAWSDDPDNVPIKKILQKAPRAK